MTTETSFFVQGAPKTRVHFTGSKFPLPSDLKYRRQNIAKPVKRAHRTLPVRRGHHYYTGPVLKRWNKYQI